MPDYERRNFWNQIVQILSNIFLKSGAAGVQNRMPEKSCDQDIHADTGDQQNQQQFGEWLFSKNFSENDALR